MSRVKVTERVAEIIAAAPLQERSRLPVTYSALDLARLIYGTDDPTPAQKSAVRRSLARLAQAGTIGVESRGDHAHEGEGWHWRSNGLSTWPAANPTPQRFGRFMTDAERESRVAALGTIARL